MIHLFYRMVNTGIKHKISPDGLFYIFKIKYKNMEELFYLAKIGEINLKKGNLKDFEMRLSQNLRSYLPEAKPNIRVRAGRM